MIIVCNSTTRSSTRVTMDFKELLIRSKVSERSVALVSFGASRMLSKASVKAGGGVGGVFSASLLAFLWLCRLSVGAGPACTRRQRQAIITDRRSKDEEGGIAPSWESARFYTCSTCLTISESMSGDKDRTGLASPSLS